MAWIEPVFDRTLTDVAALNEKGKLTHTVANRIESNTEYLSDLLDAYGYNNSETHKTDWDRPDFVYISDLERIRNNVETLTDVYSLENLLTYDDVGARTYASYGATTYAALLSTTVPTVLNAIYTDFNNIEKALFNLNNMVSRMAESFEYSGETYSGE